MFDINMGEKTAKSRRDENFSADSDAVCTEIV